MEETNKHKRNKPCENCRKHRRKCITNNDESSCARCQRAKIDCVFKFTEKPARSKTPVSITRQNELLTAVWALEKQEEKVRLELSRLKSALSCSVCQQEQCTLHRPWNLTISKGQRGIRIETSVKSLSDLEIFLKEGLGFFRSTETIPQPFSSTGGERGLNVTHPFMKVDGVFRTLFYCMAQEQTDLAMIKDSQRLRQECHYFKLKMVQNYFSCIALLVPLLPIPIYLPKLCNDLDSLLATTIAYLAGSVPCTHVELTGLSYTRKELANACRLEAKRKFEECLFEQDPAPETCGALLLMAVSSIYDFRGKEARIYASLCWNMINQIDPIEPKTEQDEIQEQIRVRVFYLSRYVEYIFLQSKDDSHCHAHATAHIDVSPKPLASELAHKTYRDSLSCFQFLTRIMAVSRYGSDHEATMFSFFGGRLNTISSESIVNLEHVLLEIWKALPSELRIGRGPFEYMGPQVLDQYACNKGFSLRVNAAYYVYWLSLQTKIMQRPSESFPAYGYRMDADRALMISSICADAATKIYSVMEEVSPCMFEIRWLATTMDILRLLSESPVPDIKSKAKENIAVLSKIIRNQLEIVQHGVGRRNSCSSLESEESKWTQDTDASSRTTYITPIFTHMKGLLRDYMIDNDIIQG